jgi:fumarate reductase subunit C
MHDVTQAAPDATVHEVRRWAWQRLSALMLAGCVAVHLVLIVYATRGGLSAGEILGRTRGSWAFGGFYAVFVAAAAVHVPIGLARIAEEWLAMPPRWAWAAARGVALALAVLGLRAVWAVVAGG